MSDVWSSFNVAWHDWKYPVLETVIPYWCNYPTIARILLKLKSLDQNYDSVFLIFYFTQQDGGKQLQEGMEDNTTIILMDLRLTECGQESEYCINQILHRNQEADRQQRITDSEAVNSQYRKTKIEPQAAHRYQLPSTAIIAWDWTKT